MRHLGSLITAGCLCALAGSAAASVGTNALTQNALTQNALTVNSVQLNSLTVNAVQLNALIDNGLHLNGTAPTGAQGEDPRLGGGLELKVEAVELAR